MSLVYLLNILNQNSIDELKIINPDPWHKKRHFKRRLVNLENIIKIIGIVKNKYASYITTDSESYFNYINEIFSSNSKIIHENKNKILSKNDRLYGVSRYKRKAIVATAPSSCFFCTCRGCQPRYPKKQSLVDWFWSSSATSIDVTL